MDNSYGSFNIKQETTLYKLPFLILYALSSSNRIFLIVHSENHPSQFSMPYYLQTDLSYCFRSKKHSQVLFSLKYE